MASDVCEGEKGSFVSAGASSAHEHRVWVGRWSLAGVDGSRNIYVKKCRLE